jgi:hypothetical protein
MFFLTSNFFIQIILMKISYHSLSKKYLRKIASNIDMNIVHAYPIQNAQVKHWSSLHFSVTEWSSRLYLHIYWKNNLFCFWLITEIKTRNHYYLYNSFMFTKFSNPAPYIVFFCQHCLPSLYSFFFVNIVSPLSFLSHRMVFEVISAYLLEKKIILFLTNYRN